MTKTYTEKNILDLLEKIEGLEDDRKKQYLQLFKELDPELQGRFAEILQNAADKVEEIQKEHLPKIIELHKQKIAKIKEFMQHKLPEYMHRAEEAEGKEEAEEAEELLKEL